MLKGRLYGAGALVCSPGFSKSILGTAAAADGNIDFDVEESNLMCVCIIFISI